MAIFFNESQINDWNFGDDNIIKVYRNNAVCYYKITTSGGTPSQTPCYAVVDDISQYSDTEFEDVFNKADNKWYKLNNLNQYEEYGVYGSGRTITYYDGKLTIDTESIPQPSRLPQGYTEVEYIRQNSNYDAYINTGVILFDNTSNTYTVTTKLASEFHSNLGCATIISAEVPVSPYNGMGYRYKCSSTVDQLEFFGGNSNYTSSVVDNGDGTRTVTFQSTGNTSWTSSAPLSLLCSFSDTSFTTPFRYADATIYSATVVKNGVTVRDFVPARRDSDSKYGLYDLITDTFYTSPNGNNFSGGSEVMPPPITATCEFMYSGASWNNVGEVSGSSRLPQGYTEVEYVENNTKGAFINLGLPLYDAIGNSFNITGRLSSEYYAATGYDDLETLINSESISSPYYGFTYRYAHSRHILEFTCNPSNSVTISTTANTDGTTSLSIDCNSTTVTDQVPLGLFASYSGNYNTPYRWAYMKLYYLQVTKNNTLVRDLVPCKRDSDSMVGLYDLSNDVFYYPPNYTSYQLVAGADSGGVEYPIYYDDKQDPPNNLTFNSMTEAEEYECPWVGMSAMIDGVKYVFSGDSISGYEWVYQPQIACEYNFCGVDANGNDVIINNGTTTLTQSNWSSPYPVEGIVGDATTTIGQYCFRDIKGTLSALTIGSTVTTIQHEAFMETAKLTTLTIPSSVTQIDFWAFTRCNGLTEVIFEGTTPPTFTNQYKGVFHDYCPPVIYVPDEAVSAYRAIAGSVWTNKTWSSDIIQPISNR